MHHEIIFFLNVSAYECMNSDQKRILPGCQGSFLRIPPDNFLYIKYAKKCVPLKGI